MKQLLLALLFFTSFSSNDLWAQSLLSKSMTVNVNKQKLADVLEIISNQGNFYFSYNSNIVKRDSIVTLQASNRTVKQLLETLFTSYYEFRESGNYIIIRRKPIQLLVTTKPVVQEERFYSISGYVSDGDNGARLPEASVYEKQQLASSLTDDEGYFKLKLKSRIREADLTFSKEFYHDTTVAVDAGTNQQLEVWLIPIESGYSTISPEDYLLPDSVSAVKQMPDTSGQAVAGDSNNVDSRFLSRAFVSTRQKIQSLNLGNFFANRPFQFSLTPGLSTHGKMSGQVINNVSFNLFGGYTGGLKGFELGGLFNINKKDAGYLQAAGLFNLTGGAQSGLQLAGISNTVLDSLSGLQVAGVTNFAHRAIHGVQISGVYNHTDNKVKGVQIAGVGNFARRTLSGTQVAGVFNFADKTNGAQIAGVVNYTNHLKGVQIGLINIADTSDGYSIGLINFVRRGYHKMYIGSNELNDLTVALKSGNRKLYSIFLGGANADTDNKLYSFGYGMGREWLSTKVFALSTDITSQYLYLGSWDYLNLLNKFSLNLHLKLGKGFAFFGGPSFNMYYSEQPSKIQGYSFNIPRSGFASFEVNNFWRGWGGWHAGISIF